MIAAAEEAGELAVTLRAASKLELPQAALDPAEEIGLVRIDGAVLSFRHPLVRSVVYESATLGQRQRTDAALAAALEGADSAERAAWHRAMGAVTRTRRLPPRSKHQLSAPNCGVVTSRPRAPSNGPRR